MLLLFLLLVAGSHCAHYELEGHLADISHSEVSLAPRSRSHFAPAEMKLRNRMETLFKEKLQTFFVEKFEIHGEGIHPSAMFTAFMTTPLSRGELVSKFKNQEHLTIFRLKEIARLPDVKKDDGGPVEFCTNGGLLLPNNTCACRNFFTGPICEITNCLNQGIAGDGNCACPPGVYASNCEPRGCLPQVKENINNDKQSFILVVNQKESMSYILNNLVTYLNVILGPDANAYDNFILVNYVQTDKALYMQSNLFYTLADLIEFLNSILFTSQGRERQPNNMAIYQAQNLNALMRPRSIIFVLIDSLDSDVEVNNYLLSSDSMVNKVILKTLAWRNRVIYLISQSRGMTLDTSDPGYEVYRQVSETILGDIVSYEIQEWYQALSIMGEYNQNENIAVRYNYESHDSVNITLTGEDSGQFHALLSVGPNGTLPTITNSESNVKTDLSGKRFQLISFPADTQTLTIGPSPSWNLRVWAESSTTILLGYDFDQNTDVGSAYIPRDYKPILSGAVINGVAQETTVQWINTNDGSQIGTSLSAKQRPQECSYPLSFGAVTENCIPGPFAQQASIQLVSWERITRIVPGYCVSLDKQKPTEFLCYNGGTKEKGRDRCDCTRLFTGDNCGDPICHNGGSQNLFPGNGFGLCNCNPGFSGDHCDIVNCTSQPSVLPSSRTTLALVVQNTLSQAHISQNISNGINNLIFAMKGKDQFYNLMLTTFRTDENGQTDTDFVTHQSISAFEADVRSIQYLPAPVGPQDVFHGIQSAALNIVYQYSPMFVFVDSPPTTTTTEMYILLSLVSKKIQLNFVITPPFGLPELCMNDKDTAIYQDLVSKTGGILVNLCKPFNPKKYAADPISMIFSGYAASHHGTESINEFYEKNIVADDEILFFNFNIDQPQNDAFFIVNCPNTESFNANLTNYELNSNIALTSIASMPFLGVYKLPLFAATQYEYTVQVTKKDGIPFVAPCFLKVVLKSTEQVYINFVHDGTQDATEQFLQFAIPLYPVVHIASNRLDRNFSVIIASFETPETSDVGIMRTGSCTYEYYFNEQVACGFPSQAYIFKIFGTTLDGQTYMRSIRSFCYQTPGKCQNGGTFINGPTPKCTCPPNFTGQFCQVPICPNAAVSSSFTCYCGRGYTGEFCNHAMCEAYNFMESVDPRTFDARQVTFVLNRNIQNLLVNTQLSNIIRDFVDHIGSFGAPTVFSLVIFDDKIVQSVVSTSNIDQFVYSFKNSINAVDDTMPETTRSIDAINEAFKLNIQPPGVIFVFTPSDPSSPDQAMIDKFLTQRLDTQVNIFYTPSARYGYPTLPVSSNTTDLLYQTVKQSGGRFLPLTQNSISQINPLLKSVFTQHELVFDDAYKDCSSMQSFYFDLESAFGSAEITINGFDVSVPGKVEVYSGEHQLSICPSNIIFKDNAVFVLRYLNQNNGGKWTVRVQTTTGSCGCQVRVASDTRVIPGFTADMYNDFVYSMPFTGQGTIRDTYAVYRITNTDSEYAPYLQYMKVSKTNYAAPYSERSPLVQLGVQARDTSTCAYQFVSDKWTVDPFPYQKVVLQGNDAKGSSWMRTFYYTFQSANSITSCVNGKPDSYGQCICSDKSKWTGDNCDSPICQNGGTPSYGVCVCMNGYYGQFCELLVTNKSRRIV